VRLIKLTRRRDLDAVLRLLALWDARLAADLDRIVRSRTTEASSVKA
jgi:hypothetical protein